MAGLQEFGFKKYYNDIFYYAIPTSGPLYQYYSDLVHDEISKEKIIEAMDFAGVNQAYFVINNYWYGFDKIIEKSKELADSYEVISDEKIYIFKFSK